MANTPEAMSNSSTSHMLIYVQMACLCTNGMIGMWSKNVVVNGQHHHDPLQCSTHGICTHLPNLHTLAYCCPQHLRASTVPMHWPMLGALNHLFTLDFAPPPLTPRVPGTTVQLFHPIVHNCHGCTFSHCQRDQYPYSRVPHPFFSTGGIDLAATIAWWST